MNSLTKATVLFTGYLLCHSISFANSENFQKVFFKSLNNNASIKMLSPQENNAALTELLTRNWELPTRGLEVWQIDPNAKAQPDFSELKKVKIKNLADLSPEHLGMESGWPLASIDDGPFEIESTVGTLVFIATQDSRPWGYDKNRCFIIGKRKKDMGQKTPSSLFPIDCKKSNLISESAQSYSSTDLLDLDSEATEILESLYNRNFARETSIQKYSSWRIIDTNTGLISDKTYTIKLTDSFQFSLLHGLKKIQYNNFFSEGWSSSTSNKPTHDISRVRFKKESPTKYVFTIVADTRSFMSLDAKKMNFVFTHPQLLGLKSAEEYAALPKTLSYSYHCYPGHDCSERKNLLQQFDGEKSSISISARQLTLTYDLNKPEFLELSFQLTDPSIPDLSVTLRDQDL